jgi:ketosteroid isomerase-like protein
MSTESQESTGGPTRKEEEAITQAVHNYPAAFRSGDVQALLELWDPQIGEQLTYISVEKPEPTYGLEAMQPYYQLLCDHYVVLGGDVSNLRISVEGNVAYAVCDILWSWDSKAGGAALTLPARTTILLRKRGERWLYQHLHESITWTEPQPA